MLAKKIVVDPNLPFLLISKNVMAGLLNDPDVAVVQRRLNEINPDFKLKVDSDAGPKLESAIEEFQISQGLDADGEVGPKTRAALRIKLNVEMPTTLPGKDKYDDGPAPSSKGHPKTKNAVDHDHDVKDAAPWLDWMESYLHAPTKTGAPATEFNQFLFEHTSYGKLKKMVAGCAATVCTALEETGYKSVRSARAKDHLNMHTVCAKKVGAVVIFRWPAGNYHVSFVHKILADGRIVCLGGNQGHMIKDSTYSTASVVGYRWPSKARA